ncbi:MAG: FliM/FliN family flagellar motor switch protein [Legionellaceae bacterium]|nr:FliM/FliN family flagellar motor switch protein [Legionellaceae bacterium]
MSTAIENLELPNLQATENPEKLLKQTDYLALLADMAVNIELHIGHVALRFDELQQLKKGQILSLDKRCDEAVELKLQGKTIACGELVACDDHYAVRLTAVPGPKE